MRKYSVAVLCCSILAGCSKQGEKPTPASAPPTAVATGVTASATAPSPPPPEPTAPVASPPAGTPEPEVIAANYSRRLREVEVEEHDTDFMQAIALCEAMLNDFQEPDQQKEITATINRLIDQRRRSTDLAFAIQSLGSDQFRVQKVAADLLAKADDVGLMFLRHAWRTKEEPIALEAGRLLREWGDKGAIQGFVDTIVATPDSPLGRRAAEGLVAMVESLDMKLVQACFDAVGKDTNYVAGTVFDVLEAVFSQTCARDETAFNGLAGHPYGWDTLRRHVGRALLSDKPETVTWACECLPDVLPLRSGFRVRYYPNTEFEGAVIDRMEDAVRLDLNQSPFTEGRRENISVRWTSDVLVNRMGDHAVNFRSLPSAPRAIGMWLDGEKVLDFSHGGGEQGATLRLKEGWHTLRIEFVRKQGGDTPGDLAFDWTPPKPDGAEGEPAIRFMQRPAPEEVADWRKTASDLGSEDGAVVKAARRRLAGAGSVGHLILFHVLDTQTGAARRQAVDELCAQARSIAPWRLAMAYNMAMAPDAEAVNAHAALLCATLWQVCNSERDKFNDFFRTPQAYDELKARIEAALISDDKAVVARACRDGYPFAPELQGLHGRYFADPEYRELATERLDGKIDAGKPHYPVPPERQGAVSIEWAGRLVVEKEGPYSLWPDGRGAFGFYVDGAGVGWGTQIALATGIHTFRGEFHQADTNAESRIRFDWDIPGVGRCAAEGFRCSPWDGRLEALGAAAGELASGDLARIGAARSLLGHSAGVGLLYLRNAVRYAMPLEAAAAATFLAGAQDKDAAPVLLARLQTEKDAAATVALTDALSALADTIDPKVFPELYKAALAKEAEEVNPYASILCAALWRVCTNEPAAFGKLVGDAEGHARLESHVSAALVSKDKAVVARACRNGYPFAPLLPGLRGKYYGDTAFLNLIQERLDAQISAGNRQLPLPTNHQDNVSVEWNGWISIPAQGEYTFQAAAEDWMMFYIDGKHMNVGDWRQPVKCTLGPGLHPFSARFAQGRPGANSNYNLNLQGAADLRSAPWDGKLAELSKALPDLFDADPAKVSAARAALSTAGDVGRLYLLNAVRHGPPLEAAGAATFLAELGDKEAPPVLLARMKTDKDEKALESFVEALRALAPHIDEAALPELQKAALAGEAARMNRYAMIMCSVLISRGGDRETFNKLVNDPNGYQSLLNLVQTALSSESPEAVREACRYGAPFAPSLPGFLGRYYLGQNFLDLSFESYDAQINVANRQFPYPEGRQDDISVRWAGLLNVPQPGDYTFEVRAAGGANAWVDGVHVAHSSGGQPHKRDTVKLSNGWHSIRVDMWQSGGNNQVQLQWTPPGSGQTLLSGVMSAPSASMLAQIEKDVAAIVAATPEQVAGIAGRLRGYGDVSVLFLNHALRRGKAEAAIVPLLVELRDPSLVDLIRHLRKSDPAAAASIEAALESLVEKPGRGYGPWFYAVMKSDEALAFPVSGRFLSKALQEACLNDEGRFNREFAEDDQGAANLKAYLAKLPKE